MRWHRLCCFLCHTGIAGRDLAYICQMLPVSGYCGCLKLRLSLSVEALTLHSHCGYCVTPSSPVVGGASAALMGYTVQSQHTAFLDNLIFFVRVMTLKAHCAQASSEKWKADVWGNVSSFLVKLLHVLCCTAEFVCDGVPVCLSCNISELSIS